MKDKTFLMIPGPTPTPESALLALARHPLGHRSTEFSAILKEVFKMVISNKRRCIYLHIKRHRCNGSCYLQPRKPRR